MPEFQAQGKPTIGVGIGINTPAPCSWDMGSDIRRSYTVIVMPSTLGSPVGIFVTCLWCGCGVGEATRRPAPAFYWQELIGWWSRARCRVCIFTPLYHRPMCPMPTSSRNCLSGTAF